jgi:hypothetical protein
VSTTHGRTQSHCRFVHIDSHWSLGRVNVAVEEVGPLPHSQRLKKNEGKEKVFFFEAV